MPTEALQAICDAAVSVDGLPGIVLGIDTPRGAFLGAAGKANIDAPKAMTTADQIRLASVTKNFTAALVLRLCEEGTISLDAVLESLLPGCGIANAGTITISHLLNHTAGVYDHESDAGLDILSPGQFEKNWTSDEILDFARNHGPDFAPGEKWSYSNTGFYLLGLIIEAVTGQTVAAAIEERLFAPLGMSRTALTPQGVLAAPCSGGYCLTPDNRFLNMAGWNMSWDWTAGGGVSTAANMLTWAKALFTGKVLDASMLAAMVTPVGKAAEILPTVGYGYGVEVWSRDEFFGQPCWSHGGANGGTRTFLLYYPLARRTLFAAANRYDYSETGIDATALLRALLIKAAPLVDFPLNPAGPAADLLLLSST